MAKEPSPDNDASPVKDGLAEELKYRLRQQELTAQFALFALQTHDTQALLQEATRVCARGLRSTMCKVMEYLPQEDQFIVRAGVGWKQGIVGKARVGSDDKSPTGYAFKTGQPVLSNHLEGERRFRTPKILAGHGVKRAINAPIQRGGERFGVLEVDSPIEGRFTDADLVFVKGFADLLGMALERQRVEEELKEKEAELQKSLQHQEMLAEEIGHRVKNSLSIVSGLLRSQGRLSSDPHLRQALSEAQSRVDAIGKVHDRLWRKGEVHVVDLAEFLQELCEHIRRSASNHQLTCSFAATDIATDEAISLGLLVNELVTNALKHAYPGEPGRVSVVLEEAGPNRLRLIVRDYGIGPAEDMGVGSGGTGFKVIQSLCRHLGGSYEWQDAKPGTRFVLSFQPNQTVDSKAKD